MKKPAKKVAKKKTSISKRTVKMMDKAVKNIKSKAAKKKAQLVSVGAFYKVAKKPRKSYTEEVLNNYPKSVGPMHTNSVEITSEELCKKGISHVVNSDGSLELMDEKATPIENPEAQGW